jgi:competence protein ComEC
VHAAARSRLGASDPRAERTPDLRLVAPALATWAVAGVTLAVPAGTGWTVAAACLIAAALCVRHARRAGGHGTVCGIAAAALLCGGAAAGEAALTVAGLHRGPLPALAARHGDATVDVALTGDPRSTDGRTGAPPAAVLAEAEALRVRAAGATTAVRTPVLLVVRPGRAYQRWLSLLPSTRLTVRARLDLPAHAGDHAAAVLRATGPPHVVGRPTAVQRAAGRLRDGLRRATAGLPTDTGALLSGLVIGDTSRVTPELRTAFERTDLLHLFAVSGANLSIVLALLIGPPASAVRAERGGLAARLGLPLRVTALLGALLTIGFVTLCRPDPSVLRAAACGLITLLAIGTGRRRALLPALAAAVIALVLYDPWLARSYGFALSVLATAALLTLAPRWAEALERRGMPPRLAEASAAAAAVQVCCAPLVAVLAAHVSLVAVPCNLLAEVAVPPATVLGFAALAAAPVSTTAAGGLAWLAGWPARWVVAVAREGAGLPGAALAWPGGWVGGVSLAAALVAVLPLGRRLLRRRRWCAAALALLLLAVVRPAPLARLTSRWPPPGWTLAACDVGQGDALALNAGHGSAVVVDTGPDPGPADRCLRALGVTEIPLLVLTHFHADHVGGLLGVLADRRVGAIETTTLDAPPGEAAFVRRRAAAAHIPVIRALAGEHRTLGGIDWQVLWPPPDALPDDDPNDASVVLLVRTAGLTILLPGDLEPDAQRELLARNPDLPRVDVLKVAHHGSAHQDPELLRRLHPRLALISVGADNSYGHPAPHTLTALAAQGTTVLRTDTDGPIAVTTDPSGALTATTARGP